LVLKSNFFGKRVVLLIILDLVLGLALPSAVFLSSYHIPGSSSIYSLPVEQSVFSEFVDASPDSVQFLSTWTINSTQPFILLHRYTQMDQAELIDSASALAIALSRLSTLNYGVWQLVESMEIPNPPSWHLTLETLDGNYSSRIGINAVSGAIFDYHVVYEHELEGGVIPDSMNEQQAEEIAVDFLRSYNYSLPQRARYDGIRLTRFSSYQSQIVNLTYRMSFQEYISDIRISTSKIRIDVSTYQRAVCSFNYDWLDVSNIPQAGILSKDTAFTKATSELANSTDPRFSEFNPNLFSIEDTFLELALLADGIDFNSSVPNAYQLCWRGQLKSPASNPQYFAVLYCDAFSGNVVLIDDSLGLAIFLNDPLSFSVLDFLMINIVLGIAALVGILTYAITTRWIRQK